MPVSLKASWEVRAGIIPGQAQPEHTRQFHLTSEEWHESKDGLRLMLLRSAEANAYAQYLMAQCSQGREVNWTETTFIWY